MKAAVLYGPYDIRIEEIAEREIGAEDVLIERTRTGMCGTDVSMYKGLIKDISYPIVLGHELAGVIGKVGEKVKDFQVGDRIYGRAPPWEWVEGKRTRKGSFAQYTVTPSKMASKLPNNISLEEAQSIEILQMTLNAIRNSGIKIGDRVAILGPGHAGLLMTQWVKIAGADRIIVTGTRECRLKVARDLGANFTVNTMAEDPVKKVKEYTDGIGPDIVIEATGRPDAVNQGVAMVKREGAVMIFGVAQEPVDGFDAYAVYEKRIKVFYPIGGGMQDEKESARAREKAVNYLASGRIAVKPLITHVLSLDETKKAFEIVDKRLEDVIRLVVKSE